MFSAASATIIHRSTFLQCSAVAATTKTTATNGVVRNTVVIRRCGQQQQRLYHHHHQHQQQRQCSINHRHNFLSTVTTKKSNNNSIVSKNRRWLSSDSATGGGGGGGVVIKPLSKQERTALRAARRERATQVIAEAKGETASTGSATSGTSSSPSSIHSKYIWYASVFVPSALLVWGFSDPNSPPAKLCDLLGITGLVSSYTDEIAKPSHDKLLPDWSQMPNVPHDIPVPHTLVLDLENTLVSSTWDRKYGWRHAKRPGVDKFLLDLAQYYEIVLYSPSIDAIADPVVTSLDKQGCIMHRLYRDATYYTGGVHVKDLNRLNRNVNRIVVIDDDPAEVQFNPENVIRVKPYTDPSDRTDNTLARITPFLIEIARENYSNIPELLSQYEGMDADEIADEQERRIQYYRDVREAEMSRGLGGLAKMARKQVNFEPDMTPQDINLSAGGGSGAPHQLSAKDIVGAAPSTSSDEKTGLVGFLSRREEEKAESTRRKFEKWNEVMMRKAQEKEAKARAAAAAAAGQA